MKRIIPFVFAIGLLGLIITTSCSHPKLKYRLAQIDTLSILLDKTELTINELNNDSLLAMLNNVCSKNEALATSHAKLTINEQSDCIQLDSVEKQFKGYVDDHVKNVEALKYLRKQLNDLKDNLEKHTIKGEKFDEYYQTENTSVNNLFNMVKLSLYNAKQNIERYNVVNPVITKLMADKKIKVNAEVSGNLGKKDD